MKRASGIDSPPHPQPQASDKRCRSSNYSDGGGGGSGDVVIASTSLMGSTCSSSLQIPVDAICHCDDNTSTAAPPVVVVKTEIYDSGGPCKLEPKHEKLTCASASGSSSSLLAVVVKSEPPDGGGGGFEQRAIKSEPVDMSTSTPPLPPLQSVAVQTQQPTPAPVVPLRPSCSFGIRCFRRGPAHRNDMAHPGDPDYRRPNHPPAPSTAPACPFAARCYRRDPEHFRQFAHPPSGKFCFLVIFGSCCVDVCYLRLKLNRRAALIDISRCLLHRQRPHRYRHRHRRQVHAGRRIQLERRRWHRCPTV